MTEPQWTRSDLIRLIATLLRRSQTYLQPEAGRSRCYARAPTIAR
jgi:hypothetical protein